MEAHTPTTPASDDRPLRYLERTPVPEAHLERLRSLVRMAQALGSASGDELQAEFGKDHVALIVGCNQFVRLDRGGPAAGRVELFLDEADRKALAAAGYRLHEHPSPLFRLLGWTVVDPMEGEGAALEAALAAAYRRACAARKPR